MIGAIRTGLALELKGIVSASYIHTQDEEMAFRALSAWQKCPGLWLVGADRPAYFQTPRLSIISFNVVVRHPDHPEQRLLLHPHFVAAVLNDVYGIQVRHASLILV